ncbi:MAG: ATP-binding cassette domain-containing protein [Spirochaetota bacterium]
MTYAIKTHGLNKTFGSLRAVDGLNLGVKPAGIYGFLGPNGAGKTTTIRLLLGLVTPDSGDAEVFGIDVRHDADSVRAQCGALLEHDGLYERLSAETNLDLAGRIWKMDRDERAARTGELLDRLGLSERKTDPVGDWSRGMKRKLAVARALYHRPRLAFLDEPTSGLDPVASAALVRDLRELVSKDETTVFLTTHNLGEAEKLCDVIGVLRDGRLVAEGTPDEIRGLAGGRRVEVVAPHPSDFERRRAIADELATLAGVREVRTERAGFTITLDQNTPAAPIVKLLVSRGVDIEEVRKGTASLEEAFLALVEPEGGEDVA